MLKKLLHRLLRRPVAPSEPEELPLAPLTMFVPDPDPEPVELIDVDNLFFPWLLGMAAPAPHALDATEERLLRALKRAADSEDPSTAALLPRMPAVLPLLLRSLRDPEVSNRHLAQQVAQDPVLVAAVLRQVNSSYYRQARPVRTIEDAIAVIGQNGLRILVARVAFTPLFNAQLGRLTALGTPRAWELAEPYGMACGWFAKARDADGFEAYLACLLRSVGVIVALRVMDQAGGAAQNELHALDFAGSFHHYARRLAGVVGEQWEFPQSTLAAVSAPATADGLAGIVHLADRTSKIRLLVRHGVLAEEHAEACLEREEAVACYREMVELEAAGEAK